MNINRSQHIVPRSYLKPFLSPGLVYARGFAHPKKVHSPKNVAASAWFYSPAGDDTFFALDRVNTFLENNCSPVLHKIRLAESTLTQGDKRHFSYFVANLFLRVPSTFARVAIPQLEAMERMQENVSKLQEVLKTSNRRIRESLSRRPGPRSWTGTPEEFAHMLESLRAEVQSGKPLMRTVMSNTIPVARAIADMTWVLASAPAGSFFVTSNNPVGLTHLNGSQVGVGWLSTSAFATLPISPELCLLMFNKGDALCHHVPHNDPEVAALNARTILLATDAIYSPQYYVAAQQRLDEWRCSQDEGIS